MKNTFVILLLSLATFSCSNTSKKETKQDKMEVNQEIKNKADEFASFKLTTDLSVLSEKEKQMLPLLFEAAKIMDDIFWMEAYGNKEELLGKDWDEYTRKFIQINYGPWERLDANKPFVPGFGPKLAGANFYPADITKAEFEAWEEESKTSLYTLIRRGEDGKLKSVPYHVAFRDQVENASALLKQAAELAEDAGLITWRKGRKLC